MSRGDERVLLALARSDAADRGGVEPGSALPALERLASLSDLHARPLVAPVCLGARRLGLWSGLSVTARDALDRARHESIARTLQQRRWLREVLRDLERSGIACALLKGAAFNGTLYPDDAPRLGGDIDLLVRDREFEPACRVIAQRARPAGPRRDRRASHRVGYEVQFLTEGPFAVLVELHRALTVPHVFDIDHDRLIARGAPHPSYKLDRALVLDREDALLHLAVHAFRHLRLEGHVLLDAHEAWVQWKPDADVLVQRAAGWGASTALYLLLDAVRDHVGTPIPDAVLARLAPGRVREGLCRGIYRVATSRDLKLLDRAYRPVQLASLAAVPDRRFGVLRYVASYAVLRVGDLLVQGPAGAGPRSGHLGPRR